MYFLAYSEVADRPIPHPVPDEYAKDFRETNAVLKYSENASAAVSRRYLQSIIQSHYGIIQATFSAEISEFIATVRPASHVEEPLSAPREVGNFEAHPRKDTKTGDVLHVEPGEAEYLLDVLESVFDSALVQSARRKAAKKLNEKLTTAGKRPIP